MSSKAKGVSVLIVSTLPFTVCFMIWTMYAVVWVSLIWMYWTEVRGAELMGRHAKAFSLKG